MWCKDEILLDDNYGNILICTWILSWRRHFWWFHIFFKIWICLSRWTVTPVIYKRETSVAILDNKKGSFGSDGYNRLIRVDILVTFCVLVDSSVFFQQLMPQDFLLIFYTINWFEIFLRYIFSIQILTCLIS